MIRRTYARLLVSAGLAAGAWILLPRAPGVAVEHKLPTGTNAVQEPAVLGSMSCSASACHGAMGAKGSKGSEFSTWAAYDPHAGAFTALSSERSRRIVRNLNGPNAARPEKNTLCLSCHAMKTAATGRGDKFFVDDGIGCEACHGNAEKWLTQHYLPEWDAKSAADKAGFGMKPTKDLVARANLCVTCHVGSPDKEVNHDLIAAGHPRLNFEFGSHHAVLPKHWDEHKEKASLPDFEARAWAVGQAVSTRAALALLGHRADPKKEQPSAKFAEYDCFACHHDLASQAYARNVLFPNDKQGFANWSSWYTSLPLQGLPARGGEDQERLATSLRSLTELMNQRIPDRSRVSQQARDAATQWDKLAFKLNQESSTDAAVLKLWLNSLSTEPKPPASWDEAAQRYLAAAAFYHALGDLGHKDARLKAAIQDRGKRLAFPKRFDSPRDFELLKWLERIE